jgi:hypothetical protein
LTKSQREKLNLPEEQQKIEKKAAEANPNLEAPPAASDFKDFYNYKSDLTPESLRDNPLIPQQLFDLSDNGSITRLDRLGDGAHYDPNTKKVNVGTGERYNPLDSFARVVVHEYGHRAHIEKGWFGFDVDENDQAHEKAFAKSEKIFKTLYGDRAKVNWQKVNDKYVDFFKGTYTKEQIGEFVSQYADTIMSVSKAKFGWGHGITYMSEKKGRMRRMEWFAHASENYWIGNPVFKMEFPELHDHMLEYYRELVIKPNFPKEQLNF